MLANMLARLHLKHLLLVPGLFGCFAPALVLFNTSDLALFHL